MSKLEKCSRVILTIVLVTMAVLGMFTIQQILAKPQDPQQQSSSSSSSHAQQTTTLPHVGVFQSPFFSAGAYGDSTLGFIAETKLASYIGDSERYALALELNAGPKIFRANATYGVGLTNKQRIKLTFDRLQQVSK